MKPTITQTKTPRMSQNRHAPIDVADMPGHSIDDVSPMGVNNGRVEIAHIACTQRAWTAVRLPMTTLRMTSLLMHPMPVMLMRQTVKPGVV